MTTKAGRTHDIEIALPTGSSSGFMLARDENGLTSWRRRTISLTPPSSPSGPADSQSFPPEIRQEIKLRTGHGGVGLLRHVEGSGFVGESKGVDTRWADIFIPGPKPIYIDDVDILVGAGDMEDYTATVPDGWTAVSGITTAEEATIVRSGGASAKLTSNGAGDLLRYTLTHGEFLQCRVTAHGYVYVATGQGDPTLTLANSLGDITDSPSTKDAWTEVTLQLDVGTTALSSLTLDLEPANGAQMYVDDWTVYIEYFTGPPGPYAQMKISSAETLFMASARTVWKVDATTGVHKAQDLAPAVVKDLELFDDRLYSALGGSNNFENSTDGSTWNANSLSGDDRFADGFAVSENALGTPVLWKYLQPNKLAASTTPLTAGSWMHWTIGDSDTNILNVLPMPDGSILITKEDGVFELGASGIPRNITPSWRKGRFDKQGAGAAEWLGRAYIPSGRASIWEVDTQILRHRRINPASIGSGPELYSGRASRLQGDGSWLHAFLTKPGESSTESEYMAGAPDVNGNWHWGHLAEIDAGEVESSWITSDVGTGPRLYFGSREQAVDDVAQSSSTKSVGLGANDDNSSAREWSGPTNIYTSNDAYATWPDESVLATGDTSSGTQAVTDYSNAETWSDETNLAASDNSYATSLLDKENTGATSGGTFSGSGWTTPSNASASDDSRTTATVTFNGSSTLGLIVTNLGLSIPTDAVVTAIQIDAEGLVSAGSGNFEVLPWWSSSPQPSTPRYSMTALTGTDASYSTGERTAAQWGHTAPTPATVNGSGFGAVLWGRATSASTTFAVDHVTVTVYYRRTQTDGLRVSNFGFSLPADATIRGVTAKVERKASVASEAKDLNLQLLVGGSLTGDDKADTSTQYTTSDVTASYGGASDLWGVALTKSDVEASNFGIELRVQSDGDVDCTVSVDHITLDISYVTAEDSDYLTTTTYGFAIPTGASIDGIELKIERKVSGGSFTDLEVFLLKAGVQAGTNKASATPWTTSDTTITYGSSSDLWGTTWSVAEVNATNFGAQLAINGPIDNTASVDHMEITIYYTAAAGSELNNRSGYLTLPTTENPRFCDCYVFADDVTMRTGVLNRFPGWKTAWQEVIIKSSSNTSESLGSSGRQVKVKYDIQDGNGFQELGGSGNGTISVSPIGTGYFKTATVSEVVSEDIEIEIELEQDAGVPVVKEISIVGTVRPPVVDVFQFTVVATDWVHARDGQTTEQQADQLAVLRGLNSPDWTVTLYDRDGTAHECYVLTDGGYDEQDILDYNDPESEEPQVMKGVALTLIKVPNSDSWPS